MTSEVFNEEHLPDLLPLYYRRLFPHAFFYKWLCYGDPKKFEKREISFTLFGDIYIRYQSFKTIEDFVQTLCKKFPVKIDIGAIYRDSVMLRSAVNTPTPVEREVVFDIDLTDYDEIRTCCSGADVCLKCWKFMVIACKILNVALREDFGYSNILWVFSGRRGIHCWVADKNARVLNNSERSALAEYLQIIKSGLSSMKRVKLPLHIHHSIKRALKIIDEYFVKSVIIEQDILGSDARINEFLNCVEEDVRHVFKDALSEVQSSAQRWNAFQTTFQRLLQEQKIPRSSQHMIEEIKLYYSYPRLDINVTKSLNHLLKAPFCVHPKTGKISVPFNAKLVDNFDPSSVPSITMLINEINAYDAKTREQEKDFMETDEPPAVSVKIKDYKKTSLLKHVNVFNEFMRGLQSAEARNASTMDI